MKVVGSHGKGPKNFRFILWSRALGLDEQVVFIFEQWSVHRGGCLGVFFWDEHPTQLYGDYNNPI